SIGLRSPVPVAPYSFVENLSVSGRYDRQTQKPPGDRSFARPCYGRSAAESGSRRWSPVQSRPGRRVRDTTRFFPARPRGVLRAALCGSPFQEPYRQRLLSPPLVPEGPITSLSVPLPAAQTAQHFDERSQPAVLQPRRLGTRSKV